MEKSEALKKIMNLIIGRDLKNWKINQILRQCLTRKTLLRKAKIFDYSMFFKCYNVTISPRKKNLRKPKIFTCFFWFNNLFGWGYQTGWKFETPWKESNPMEGKENAVKEQWKNTTKDHKSNTWKKERIGQNWIPKKRGEGGLSGGARDADFYSRSGGKSREFC